MSGTPQSVIDEESAVQAEIEQLLGVEQENQESPVQGDQISPESLPTHAFGTDDGSVESILGTSEQVVQPESSQSEIADGSASNVDDYEQKYKSLQGVYKTGQDSLAQAERDKAELEGRVSAMEQMFQNQAEPESKTALSPETKPIEDLRVSDIYTDEEVEELGQDVVKANLKAVNHATKTFRESQELRYAELESQVKANRESQEQSRKSQEASSEQAQVNQFWHDIESQIPQGKKIYQSPEFKAWAGEIPAGTGGLSRLDMMYVAAERQDANGVASFISAYQSNLQDAQTKTDQQGLPQVEPSTSAGAKNTTQQFQPQGKLYTIHQWNEYLDRAKAGQYREKTEDVINELELAMKEGRIR